MDTATPAGKLMVTLKVELRNAGLHYRDVARRLKVSEGTVKRYFSGRGVTLQVLERLAEIVGMDLLSVATLAHQQYGADRSLTRSQQAALARSRHAVTVFYFLSFGYTPAQLLQEFDLRGQLEKLLGLLESVDLIRRQADGSIKLLAKVRAVADADSHARELAMKSTRRFLGEIDLQDENGSWKYYPARLSAASAARVRELMNRFISDVEALSKSELGLSSRDTQWYRLFLCAAPTSRRKFFQQD